MIARSLCIMVTSPSSEDAAGRQRPSRAEPSPAEPEIIPPGADVPPPRREDFAFAQHGIRIHVTRLGPFGVAMLLLGGVALGAIALLMLLGAALVGAAAIGVVVVVALLARLFRGSTKT